MSRILNARNLLLYIALAVSFLAIFGYFGNKNQGDKTCDAVTALEGASTRNTEARLQQNKVFLADPASRQRIADSFGLSVKQLEALTAKGTASDEQLIADTQDAVDVACG